MEDEKVKGHGKYFCGSLINILFFEFSALLWTFVT